MASLKALTADLLSNVVSVYDQTKTTLAGNALARTFGGQPCLSSPNVKWLDVFTDSGEIPFMMDYTDNGRLFCITAISGGLARVMLYTFSATTGAFVYNGKVQFSFANTAATTHTIRAFKVDDNNTSNILIFTATTGSVAVNGGLYMSNALTVADFTPILSATLGFGVGSNQKAMYFIQDSGGIGATQANTTSTGISLDRTAKIAYVHNGTSAAHQFYLYDYSLTPNTPASTFTITIATPGVVTDAAHGFSVNDQVVLSTTGALPTGLVAGTVYFVRNPATNTFELSATSGGASIATTGAQSGVHSVSRAFGITTSLSKWKTGNLPALTGTLLNNNSEAKVTPPDTLNAGFVCTFMATTTNFYLGKLSELTAGAVAWASLLTVNQLGSTNQVVAPTAANAYYHDLYGTVAFTTSTTKFIVKPFQNNVIYSILGVLNNDYLEGIAQTDLLTETGAITLTDFKAKNGWNFILGSSTGQRGVIATNVGADATIWANGLPNGTYITTKVLTMASLSTLVGVAVASQAPKKTSQPTVYYRTSGFGTVGTVANWTLLPDNLLFPAGTTATQIQFLILFNTTGALITNPQMLQEAYLAYSPLSQISDNWEGSVDNTTQNSASPARTAFRLFKAYTSVVPQMFFRAFDDLGNLVVQADTVTNAAQFEYSTNNGTSWNALGTVPNTALTTELRYNWVAPPGVKVTCSIYEA